MDKNTIGAVAGIMVVGNIIPYAWRTYERKITPHLTSWALWTLIGLALLLTYRSSGAAANVWPAVFGFTNPLLITVLLLGRGERFTKLSALDKVCLAMGLLALGVWTYVRGDPRTAQYSLYLAIFADACAGIPTFVFLWGSPQEDRPFAWTFYGLGYGLAIFAISEKTFANYILPIYMFTGSMIVASILSFYRIKRRIPLKEWV